MNILAIDPGNIESAYVLLDNDLKPLEFGKFINENVRQEIRRILRKYYQPNNSVYAVIEMVACYGMPVGKEVFETCLWIGRFTEMVEHENKNTHYIYRQDEKLNLCGTKKAKDSNIRKALIDRFAQHDFKNGKGTKKNPDIFYGFKADIWQAMAVGVTFHDMHLKSNN